MNAGEQLTVLLRAKTRVEGGGEEVGFAVASAEGF